MSEEMLYALAIAAGVLAWGFGFAICKMAFEKLRTARYRESVMGKGVRHVSALLSPADMAIAFIERATSDVSLGKGARLWRFAGADTPIRSADLARAGLTSTVSAQGYREGRARMALVVAVICGLAGEILSFEACIVGCVVGAIVGFVLPARAVSKRVRVRASQAERRLPEMLDVISLGMRSGLSFDSSLEMYATSFDTMLASELSNAQRQWQGGLVKREVALRTFAASYDSAILKRVVETIIRSVRYGSSMVPSLEADAVEARAAYKSRREERIAKAPVKMMIPTGTLILPAMLILVLGPVILELAQGGF